MVTTDQASIVGKASMIGIHAELHPKHQFRSTALRHSQPPITWHKLWHLRSMIIEPSLNHHFAIIEAG